MQNNIKILRYNTSCLCFYDKTSLKYLFVGIRYLFESVEGWNSYKKRKKSSVLEPFCDVCGAYRTRTDHLNTASVTL